MKDTYRHLSRKLQHQLGEQPFPTDLLLPSRVATAFAGHVGFPEAADSIAYEPVQSLLAVGTHDGRVKIIGKPGVEVTMRSTSRSPTKYLGFLANKGGVLRVTQDGDIQLFSVVDKRLATSTWLQGDEINAVALLPDDPYLLLGCGSGNVRVVGILDADGQPALGAAQATELSLQPYQILQHDLDARGPVVSMDATRHKDRPLLLVLHRDSGAMVWDVRAEKIVCAALDDENEVSKPTCCCWVGSRANCFALGYDDGSILLYGVPQSALLEDPHKISAPADAQLLMTFRVAAMGVRAAPVKSLSYVAGDRSEDWLLVLGGQSVDEPDMLTKLPLAANATGKMVPWFGNIKGHALVPTPGSLSANERPSSIMVLTEGGQLVVHDLASWQPMPLTLPFQELPPINVARLVPTVSLALLGMGGAGAAGVEGSAHGSEGSLPLPSPGGSLSSARSARRPAAAAAAAQPPAPVQPVQHALTLDRVRRAARRSGGGGTGADAWPLHGGEVASSWAPAEGGEAAARAGRHPSALYFSGHRDGRVRVWDATSRVPALLQALPAAAGQERLRPVTTLEVCPFSGIVIVGHQGGEVRVYQFTDCAQPAVHRMNVDENGLPYDNVGPQPAGFQYVMRYSQHSSDITAACLATKLKLAAVADESGVVSVLDLMQPAPLWSTRALGRPLRHLAVGCHVIQAKGDEAAGAEERLVVFAAGDDSTLLMLTLEKGELLEKPLKPKNASKPLAMALLDGNGTLVPPPQGVMTFPWANNNVPCAPDPLSADSAQQQPYGASGMMTPGRAAGIAAATTPQSARASVEAAARAAPVRAVSVEPQDSSVADSLELHELPSDDEVDSSPVMAAPSPGNDAKPKHKHKFKLPKGFLRPGAALKHRASADPEGGAGGELPSSPPSSPPPPVSPSSAWATGDAGAAAGDGAVSPRVAAGVVSPPVSPQHSLGGGAAAGQGLERHSGSVLGGGLGSPRGEATGNGSAPNLARITPAEPIGSPTLNLSLGLVGSSSPDRSVHGSEAQQHQSDVVDTVDYPYLIDAEPMPAVYLLLATEDYVRVYSTENVRLGDRSTEKKAYEGVPLNVAGVFMSVHGPGVVTVSSEGLLAVRTVPGLDCLFRLRLDHSSVLGFRWSFGHDVASASAASCVSLDGQLVLVGPSNELARLMVVQDGVEPLAAVSCYDSTLASAGAAAMAAAASAASAADRSEREGDYVVPEAPPAAAGLEHAGSGGSGDLDKKGGNARGLGRFFNSVKGTATGVLDTASKTAQTALQATMGELDRGVKALAGAAMGQGGAGGAGQEKRKELPSLAALFATPVESVEDDIDYMSDGDEGEPSPSTGRPAADASPAGAAPSPRPGAPGSAVASPRLAKASSGKLAAVGAMLRKKMTSSEERGELMEGGASSSGAGGSKPDFKSGASGLRTSSSIREAYGRARHTDRTSAVRSIMERNRQQLHERGEKLQDLEQRTAQMQNDANDFASLAKELESNFANRKWWQM